MFKNQVRPAEVLRIRAFLELDGSDGMSQDIKHMSLIGKLAFLLQLVKQPDDGWTISELSLSFYGGAADMRKMDKGLENNEALMKWTPSFPQQSRMNALIHNLRKKMIRDKANPNYSVKIRMAEFANEEVDVQMPTKSVDHFLQTISSLRKKRIGIDTRIKQLDELKDIPAKERAKNTKRVLAEFRNGKA